MGTARNSGAANQRTRMGQRLKSYAENGQGRASGHHSWKRGRGGGNKIGAITHTLKEWSAKGRKAEEHESYAAKQAEIDAIEEGLESMDDLDGYSFYEARVARLDEEILNEALEDWTPYVLFNGRPILGDDYDDEWWLA